MANSGWTGSCRSAHVDSVPWAWSGVLGASYLVVVQMNWFKELRWLVPTS
jgi:hypothetical protein